ncbi:DUF1707 SHOCT-like domain-containing protein [Streptomyces sp. NPDC003691]
MTSFPEDLLRRRIREEDRDAVVRRLQEAYAEGHLTHEEMDALLGRALAARTGGDLAAVLSALPAEPSGTVSEIGSASGRIRRTGAWRVPRILKVTSAFGGVRLDLTRAVIEHPVVDIRLRLGTGGARIKVPRHAVVEVDGLTAVWKAPRYRPRAVRRGGGPLIRISGTMGLGRLKVRHARW